MNRADLFSQIDFCRNRIRHLAYTSINIENLPEQSWADRARKRALHRENDREMQTVLHELEIALLKKEQMEGVISHQEYQQRVSECMKELMTINEKYDIARSPCA